MAYISEGSKTERGDKIEKCVCGGAGGGVPTLVYDTAENKQVLVLPICHHLHLSASEGTRTRR